MLGDGIGVIAGDRVGDGMPERGEDTVRRVSSLDVVLGMVLLRGLEDLLGVNGSRKGHDLAGRQQAAPLARARWADRGELAAVEDAGEGKGRGAIMTLRLECARFEFCRCPSFSCCRRPQRGASAAGLGAEGICEMPQTIGRPVGSSPSSTPFPADGPRQSAHRLLRQFHPCPGGPVQRAPTLPQEARGAPPRRLAR